MRIRDFRWSRDIALPLGFAVVFIWGMAAGSPSVAFLAGSLMAVQMTLVLVRIERRQDEQYAPLLGVESIGWAAYPLTFVIASLIGAVTLRLIGMTLPVAIGTATLLSVTFVVILVLLRAKLSDGQHEEEE